MLWSESGRTVRLLVVHPWGGSKPRQQRWIQVAERTGWEVALVVPTAWRDDYDREVHAEKSPRFAGDYIPLPVLLSGNIPLHAYRGSITSLLRRINPDGIYVRHEPYAAATFEFFRANAMTTRVPIAFHSDQNILKRYMPPFNWAQRYVFRHASCAVAISDTVRRTLVEKGFEQKVFVVPNGINAQLFNASTRTPEHYEGRPLRIGYFGRLVPEKGIDTILRALTQFSPGEVQLRVVGSGSHRDSLQELSRTLRVDALVTWEDAVQYVNMPSLYEWADLVLVPSLTTAHWKEQFGRVVIESAASGTPVIASDSGELPNIVAQARAGWTIPEGHVHALAELLHSLRKDPARISAAGAEARAATVMRFTDDAIVDGLVNALSFLLHGGTRSPRRSRSTDLGSEGAHRPAQRRLSVTVVCPDVGGIGGQETQSARLVAGLAERGHHVRVIARSCILPEGTAAQWERIRCPRRPQALSYPLFTLFASLRLRRTRGEAITHTHGSCVWSAADVATTHLCLASLGRNLNRGSRNVWLFRTNARIADTMQRYMERRTMRSSRAIVAVSAGVRQQVERYFPSTVGRVLAIPNGVDLDRFRPRLDRRLAIRAEFGINPAELVAVFCGGDWRRKGLALAIRAIALSRECSLLVVGAGDEAESLRLCADLGVADRVRFLGIRSDPENFYNAADVFVLPSLSEGLSLAGLEAAASGLPLIIGACAGAEELVEHGSNGWIVEYRPEAIAERLAVLHADSQLRATMGAESRQRACSFSWHDMIERYIDVYQAVLDATQPPNGVTSQMRRRRIGGGRLAAMRPNT